jgi:hypothetical protein
MSGGNYSTIHSNIADSNTLVTTISTFVPTGTAKYLILSEFTFNSQIATLYGTIGRSISEPIPNNTSNLAYLSQNLTVPINSTAYCMAAVTQSDTSAASMNMMVIDSPGQTGTMYYSLWTYNNSNTVTIDNTMISILQVLP